MSDGTNSGASGGIAAGWYADPAGGEGTRWWDGAQWTDHTREPEVAQAPPSFGAYVPAADRTFVPIPTADAGSAYTRAGWWLAFSPIWVVIPQVVVITAALSLASGTPVSAYVPALLAINVIALFAQVALAYSDRHRLINAGNNSAASPWWSLLTPLAYLIARAHHVKLYAQGAWALVIWWCIATFVMPGLALLAIFAAYGIFVN